ncbi:hypothetical protein V6Z11_A04G036200 [Gossypium hirsutum]
MADPSFYHPPPLLLISILFLPGIALDHYLPISKIQPFLNCLQTSQRLINCKQGLILSRPYGPNVIEDKLSLMERASGKSLNACSNISTTLLNL